MAPEVIRNEPCSEKVDVWSYGVVLWEMLTREIPYKDVDSSAIIWGVGNNSLHLPIPASCPEGFKLIVKLCWSVKPRNRPSFKILLNHLEIAGPELLKQSEQEYFQTQKVWRDEIRSHMMQITQNGTNIHKFEEDLIRKRTAEWKHAEDIRLIYEDKLEKTNKLFKELTDLMLYLQEREREIVKRERKYFPVHKMTNRMSSTLRRIYKHNLQIEKDCNLTQGHQMNLSKNNPGSSVTNELYAQLDNSQETRSFAGLTTKKTPVVNSVICKSPKTATSQKKIRHRRLGSSDSNYLRNVKMVTFGTQTDDNVIHSSEKSSSLNDSKRASETAIDKYQSQSKKEFEEIDDIQRTEMQKIRENQSTENQVLNNGNQSTSNVSNDIEREPIANLCPDEQSLFDYMNSNDQLDTHESSDEELNRRVSQFFSQNGLLQSTENGNESIIDSHLLLNVMASRRSCITINDRDEVVVLSRNNSFRTNSTPKIYVIGDSDRRNILSYTKRDYNCNNEDGDDSWTDEDYGGETCRKYPLRRKSFARMPVGRTRKSKSSTSPVLRSPAMIKSSISDEEENTDESQRQTSSSANSTAESSSSENADVVSNQPKIGAMSAQRCENTLDLSNSKVNN